MSSEIIKEMEGMGIKHNPSIKPDKSRPYEEGEYH
jgi:hypothetical protein